MKYKKHIYTIDSEIDHERRECDDGTYRDFYTVHVRKDGWLYFSKCGNDLELTKRQAEVCMNGWNNGMSNLTFWGKLRYIITGKK